MQINMATGTSVWMDASDAPHLRRVSCFGHASPGDPTRPALSGWWSLEVWDEAQPPGVGVVSLTLPHSVLYDLRRGVPIAWAGV